jgi:hypothetical protein
VNPHRGPRPQSEETTTMASKTRKIDGMRNDETGEIGSPHMIGTTQSGKTIYKWVQGWSPVAQLEDGTYAPATGYRCNRDGDYVIERA